jgi:hypothetical protein
MTLFCIVSALLRPGTSPPPTLFRTALLVEAPEVRPRVDSTDPPESWGKEER